jgi:tetratricopeptide (TPR) repeat protein
MAVAAPEADAMSARRMVGALMLACSLASTAYPADAQLPISPKPDNLLLEGHSLYDAGRYKEAAASFERAMQLGVARPHEAAREVARSYARLGNRKQALRWGAIAELLAKPRAGDAGYEGTLGHGNDAWRQVRRQGTHTTWLLLKI